MTSIQYESKMLKCSYKHLFGLRGSIEPLVKLTLRFIVTRLIKPNPLLCKTVRHRHSAKTQKHNLYYKLKASDTLKRVSDSFKQSFTSGVKHHVWNSIFLKCMRWCLSVKSCRTVWSRAFVWIYPTLKTPASGTRLRNETNLMLSNTDVQPWHQHNTMTRKN